MIYSYLTKLSDGLENSVYAEAARRLALANFELVPRSVHFAASFYSWLPRESCCTFCYRNTTRDAICELQTHQLLYRLLTRVRNTIHENVVYRVYRYIHDPKNSIHDTYTINLGLQFSIVVQQNLINFSHNLQKNFKISWNFLEIFLNFLIFFINFKIFQNCQK